MPGWPAARLPATPGGQSVVRTLQWQHQATPGAADSPRHAPAVAGDLGQPGGCCWPPGALQEALQRPRVANPSSGPGPRPSAAARGSPAWRRARCRPAGPLACYLALPSRLCGVPCPENSARARSSGNRCVRPRALPAGSPPSPNAAPTASLARGSRLRLPQCGSPQTAAGAQAQRSEAPTMAWLGGATWNGRRRAAAGRAPLLMCVRRRRKAVAGCELLDQQRGPLPKAAACSQRLPAAYTQGCQRRRSPGRAVPLRAGGAAVTHHHVRRCRCTMCALCAPGRSNG
jgi:hypothetical protein